MKNYVAVPALCLLACCSTPAPMPAPAPPPPATRTTPAPLPAPPAAARWEDWPYTPGGWRYRGDGSGSVAMFVSAAGAAAFTMRCEPASRTIALVRAGASAGPTSMAFTTSSGR